jgi:hypothetical protein
MSLQNHESAMDKLDGLDALDRLLWAMRLLLAPPLESSGPVRQREERGRCVPARFNCFPQLSVYQTLCDAVSSATEMMAFPAVQTVIDSSAFTCYSKRCPPLYRYSVSRLTRMMRYTPDGCGRRDAIRVKPKSCRRYGAACRPVLALCSFLSTNSAAVGLTRQDQACTQYMRNRRPETVADQPPRRKVGPRPLTARFRCC